MNAFSDYSRYYAAFYQDKDYAAEADYVLDALAECGYAAGTIFELGCGQGGHAIPFAGRGCSVVGIDRSEGMIQEANRRRAALDVELASRLRFLVGDVRNTVVDAEVSAVVSLFHVMSYLPTADDLTAAFRNARAHLRPGMPFAFDFWYGDAVESDAPTSRRREVVMGDARVARTATPTIDRGRHTVDVHYLFDVTPTGGEAPFSFDEVHTMRYLFADELARLCAETGFELVRVCEWMSKPVAPPQTWNGFLLARAR